MTLYEGFLERVIEDLDEIYTEKVLEFGRRIPCPDDELVYSLINELVTLKAGIESVKKILINTKEEDNGN